MAKKEDQEEKGGADKNKWEFREYKHAHVILVVLTWKQVSLS